MPRVFAKDCRACANTIFSVLAFFSNCNKYLGYIKVSCPSSCYMQMISLLRGTALSILEYVFFLWPYFPVKGQNLRFCFQGNPYSGMLYAMWDQVTDLISQIRTLCYKWRLHNLFQHLSNMEHFANAEHFLSKLVS